MGGEENWNKISVETDGLLANTPFALEIKLFPTQSLNAAADLNKKRRYTTRTRLIPRPQAHYPHLAPAPSAILNYLRCHYCALLPPTTALFPPQRSFCEMVAVIYHNVSPRSKRAEESRKREQGFANLLHVVVAPKWSNWWLMNACDAKSSKNWRISFPDLWLVGWQGKEEATYIRIFAICQGNIKKIFDASVIVALSRRSRS